ncbi:MAG: hydroxyacylglutathione hydrolase [Cellvibrionales bacterium]|nr:hydroxyacylglutathione hydrolase [Cellvibrionales bacterium]
MTSPKITPIPAFTDNYFWLIEGNNECWIVDPGTAAPVTQALAHRHRKLTGILITHHHPDHIGGIPDLRTPGMPIIGPGHDPIELVNDPVFAGDHRQIAGHQFQILEVPGHTQNHIAYFAAPPNAPPLLFCGDTLFAAGCGRLFDGTPAQMHRSLTKLAALPPETLVHCAHEYTLANLAFAHSVEPDNPKIAERTQWAKQQRAQNRPTIPSTLALEKATNPFLRPHVPALQKAAQTHDPTLPKNPTPQQTFTTLRQMKDQFR